MASNDEISKHYDWGVPLSRQMDDLEQFGQIDPITGKFSFTMCDKCKGPLLGHIKCINQTKTLHWNEEQIEKLKTFLTSQPFFVGQLATLDTRLTVTTCNPCNRRYANRQALTNHMLDVHDMVLPTSQEFSRRMIVQTAPQVTQQNNTEPMTISKALKFPDYSVGMKFEDWTSQVRYWETQSKLPANNNFFELKQNLDRNKERHEESAFLNSVSWPTENQTITKALQHLEEKYLKTKNDKIDDLINEIRNTRELDKEKLWMKLESIKTEWKTLEIGKSPNLFCWRLLNIIGQENHMWTAKEEREIQSEFGNKNDNEIFPVYKKKYREIIINPEQKNSQKNIDTHYNDYNDYEDDEYYDCNSTELEQDTNEDQTYEDETTLDEIETLYNNQRNYQFNKEKSRSQMRGRGQNRNGFSRKPQNSYNSKGDFQNKRNQNNVYQRPQVPYNNRQNSGYKQDFESKIPSYLKKMDQDVTLLKRAITKNAKETYFINDLDSQIITLYMDNKLDGRHAIHDSGAPKSVCGTEWLNNHLKHSNLTREDLRSKSVNKTFSLGGKLCESVTQYEIPIRVESKKGIDEDLVVIACEISHDLPLLIGKNTMDSWSTLHDHKERTLICKNHENAEFQLYKTVGGHDALELKPYKEKTDEEVHTLIVELYFNEENEF